MKALGKVAAVILVLAVAVAGVAVYMYVSSRQAGVKPPVEAKPVVIGVTDSVTDLDPANAYDFFTWEILSNIMEGLVKYEPGTLNIVPGLAESWSTSQDQMTWTFKLRSGLKFSDGTPLTARDVVRSIERVMRINGDPAWLVTDFVENVTAPDDVTVVFKLRKPTPYFLSLLTTPPYFPVNPKYAQDKVDSDQTAGGAGPYRIASFQRDVEIRLEPNPYYYGEKPKAPIIIKKYGSSSALRLALESGEIDVAWRTLNPSDIIALKSRSDVKVIEVPGTFIRYICLNTRLDPTSNKLVRQALAAAINRSEIIEVALKGAGQPLYSMIPVGMWSYVSVFKEKYGDGNLELARSLLRQAGFSESKKLTIELWYTPTHYGDTEKDVAAILKEQLEKTGLITVTVKSAEWSTYVDYARKGNMMMYLLGWYPDYLDPDDYTTPFLKSTANSWTGTGYANPTMDQLLEQASSTGNQTLREQLYRQVQEILGEDVPYIPLYQGVLYIVARQGVEGIQPSPTMLFYYWTVYKT
ncbi:extracellular solute-binding protein family 5 [Desulfurococcus mucosus DSM 2162]|uniref:Extracellular solute-binding protein family 5 n=1 Tax=Desulfurococcus mucosus (strain ATCC 35584 / DSM 2162 / JCM 9187 / O7/1) TaxID=765177 RepID=E8R8N4_DESM0|nr:extracellular solute-binding protein family 5 [Desulfurococcus mucosus DSM 2162]